MSSTESEGKPLPSGQRPVKRLLKWGKEHPTIGVTVPKIDLNSWFLTINGEVENPARLSWNDVLKLPKTESTGDFHCVEGWTVQNLRWEGNSSGT